MAALFPHPCSAYEWIFAGALCTVQRGMLPLRLCVRFATQAHRRSIRFSDLPPGWRTHEGDFGTAGRSAGGGLSQAGEDAETQADHASSERMREAYVLMAAEWMRLAEEAALATKLRELG